MNIAHVGVSLLANAVAQAHKCRGQIVFAGKRAPEGTRQTVLLIAFIDQLAQQKQHGHPLGGIKLA